MVNDFGKSSKKRGLRSNEKTPWKKRSIFFELPYWSSLYVRHSLDVMHIEKNVCDSLLGTLLNIPGKTKDTLSSRLDMVEMGIRPELAPMVDGKRSYLPPSLCNLGKREKEKFCQSLHDTKVPQGWSSNIKSLVSLQELKLNGLKSHDCHVLIQNFIPIAIRPVLTPNVKVAITNLCMFFKMICAHSHADDELDKLQVKIVETICQLEMYFPPSFFDIMVHLTVHIVREVKLCGPVSFRWMYPFEREMKVLKGYVRNRYRPEACIVENYVAEEVLDFVNDYLADSPSIGIPHTRHDSSFELGRGIRGMKILKISQEELFRAHLYILNNEPEVEPYINKHLALIDEKFGDRKNSMWKQLEHNRTFISWFEDEVMSDEPDVTHTVRWISRRPSHMVISYTTYDINGYCFYTEAQDEKTTRQNSGVCVIASATHYASSRDCNPVGAEMTYYGVIKEIWEVDYGQFRVPIFKCKWFDKSKKGMYVDAFGFTLVSFNREGNKSDPFVLASQVDQVFYKKDPVSTKTGNWHFVIDGRRAYTSHLDDFQYAKPLNIDISLGDENVNEDFICRRGNEVEGVWVETPTNS